MGSTARRGPAECKPLLDAATKDLYRNNAFRITGLPVDASSREIAKHADKLKLMAELGQGEDIHTAVFALKPPPALDVIREAIQRLKDPERRIVDEFFWFWPLELENSRSDPALEAMAKGDINSAYNIWLSQENDATLGFIATHNIAVMWHVYALDWEQYRVSASVDEERRQKIEAYWRESFTRWEKLAEDNRLWNRLTTRVRQIDDPRLTTGFVRRMRSSLPEALDKINAELALAYAEAGKLDLARLHIQFMRETHRGLDNVEKTAELVLAPTKTRLREQIERAKNRAQKNSSDAPKAAKELLDQAQSCLLLFDLFFGKENDSRIDLFDEVAQVCNQVAVAYHNATGDDSTCMAILKAALPLATSIDLRESVEKNIGIFSGNIRIKELEGVYALLKSIQDSGENPKLRLKRFEHEVVPAITRFANPAGVSASHGSLAADAEGVAQLFDSAAIVLRGIAVDAWNAHYDSATAIAAIKLALNYACDHELRNRLLNDRRTLRQLAAAAQPEAPAQKSLYEQPAKVWGWLVGVGIIILLVALGNCDSSNTGLSKSSYTAPSRPSSSTPYSQPSPSYGNTYRVPSYVSSELSRERQAVENYRTQVDRLGDELNRLGREIERERLYLDETSQYAVDQFNAKVRRYNQKLEEYRWQEQTLNWMVDNYNAKLRQYGK